MALCNTCRQAFRRVLARQTPSSRASLTTKPPSTNAAAPILLSPTWSVRSLLASENTSASSAEPENITPAQLHHLLRLSALPMPASKKEEDKMIETLQSQLQFVRAVQSVDTRGVEPLRAIRDETREGTEEITLGLDALKEALGREDRVGFYRRPRRRREEGAEREEAEDWDVLGTASKRAGKFFVVDAGGKGAKE